MGSFNMLSNTFRVSRQSDSFAQLFSQLPIAPYIFHFLLFLEYFGFWSVSVKKMDYLNPNDSTSTRTVLKSYRTLKEKEGTGP